MQGFRFRGNYQRAVRAPNISELFSPVVTGLDQPERTDPCSRLQPALYNTGTGQLTPLGAVCVAQGAPLAALNIASVPRPTSTRP